ncbi:hypothetical protein ACFSTC_46610 [Nonomuraea ferruginea]
MSRDDVVSYGEGSRPESAVSYGEGSRTGGSVSYGEGLARDGVVSYGEGSRTEGAGSYGEGLRPGVVAGEGAAPSEEELRELIARAAGVPPMEMPSVGVAEGEWGPGGRRSAGADRARWSAARR